MPDIEVNREGFTEFQRRQGIESERELARRMGMNVSTVSRALSGKSAPGRQFIAAALRLFGSGWFNALFTVVD
jgi:transcriptional regulator with XRE-family HTH domain